MGTLHGGVLCDLADAAMGIAYAVGLARGETVHDARAQDQLHEARLAVAPARRLGRVVKRGRTVGLVECDVLDDKGSLVARASSTCMTLRGEAAKGR